MVWLLTIGQGVRDDETSATIPPPGETDSDGDFARLDPDALTDLALADALVGRQWIQVERFDQPVPTSVSATIDVVGSASSLEVNGHDHRRQRHHSRSADRLDCGYETLALSSGQRIQVVPGVSTFDLFDETGDAIARFADVDTLEPATVDDLPGTWLLDGGHAISLTDFGTGLTPCMQLRWELDDGRLTTDTFEFGLCPEPGQRSPEDEVIALADELLDTGSEVRRVGADLLVIRERRAVTLRALPEVDVDPNGITLAAGTAFGIAPGLGVDPEAAVATVTGAVGAPTDESGWIDPATLLADGEPRGVPLARNLSEYRLVRWGDLEFSFARTGSRTALAYWSVGSSELLRSGAPTAADGWPEREPSDLATEHGVRVGDPRDSLPDGLGVRTQALRDTDPAAPPQLMVSVVSHAEARPLSDDPMIRGGLYDVIGDEVVGFGTGTCN